MVNINISSKRWLIVGGGEVATRRLKKIIESEGSVKLVGKSISKQIKNISKKNKNIKLLERSYRVSDLNSTDFVIACTNNKDLNDKIIKASRKKNILASNASNQKLSDFSFTSTFKLNKDIFETIYHASLEASCECAEDRETEILEYKQLSEINSENNANLMWMIDLKYKWKNLTYYFELLVVFISY